MCQYAAAATSVQFSSGNIMQPVSELSMAAGTRNVCRGEADEWRAASEFCWKWQYVNELAATVWTLVGCAVRQLIRSWSKHGFFVASVRQTVVQVVCVSGQDPGVILWTKHVKRDPHTVNMLVCLWDWCATETELSLHVALKCMVWLLKKSFCYTVKCVFN